MNRRQFLMHSGAGLLAGTGLVSTAMAARLGEPQRFPASDTRPPLQPVSGGNYNPVVTLNGGSLPWRMKDGAKEFHLIAEPVRARWRLRSVPSSQASGGSRAQKS